MKKTLTMIAAGAGLALAAALAVPAIAQIVSSDVVFPRGSTSTTINASIKGSQTRDYVIRASAGQLLTVRMTGSSNAYFNVLPPGSTGEAIHIGSAAGNTFSGTLSASGAYRVRVYQMRASARRGETATYRLSLSVTGHGTGASAGGPHHGRIDGIRGMDGIRAFDELRARGFVSVDSITSGNTLYGIYFYRPGRLCVQTTSADNRIVDIRDITTHPKCR